MIQSRQRTSSTGSWTSRYFLSDKLSLRLILDPSGNVLGRQAHLPFGEDFGETGIQEKHHFTSYERDGAGQDYAINRGYSAIVGRFGSADPYRPSGFMSDPQSWNRYAHTRNDPMNRIDPLGLEDEETWFYPPESMNVNGNAGKIGGVGGGDEMLRVQDVILDPGVGQEIPGGLNVEVPIAPIPEPPPPRPRLPKGTDKGAVKDFNRAWEAAVSLLEKEKCADLFGGRGTAFAALSGATFRFLPLGGATVDENNIAHVIGAATTGNAVFINTQGPFRNTNILVQYPDGRVEFRTVDFNAGVPSGRQFAALLLLHELGHLTGVFQSDANNPELNRQQTQQVLDACF